MITSKMRVNVQIQNHPKSSKIIHIVDTVSHYNGCFYYEPVDNDNNDSNDRLLNIYIIPKINTNAI